MAAVEAGGRGLSGCEQCLISGLPALAEGNARIAAMKRRIACLIVLTAAVWSLAGAGPAAAQSEPGPLRVYVVVLDGLKPGEVGALTPTLNSLRAGGSWYEQARAVFPSETLPNHAAMMTGVLPQRNGVIGNQYWYPNEGGAERFYMEEPSLLDTDTVTTTLENECGARISTATVMSKDYLYGLFRGEAPRPGDPNPQREADFHWQAPFYIPASGHIPDTYTMDAFRTWIRDQPATLPQFAFVNLGDIDRAGHADEVGGATSGLTTPARQAVIEDTDAQLGLLIDDLEASGAWDETVLILSSDHGMDWGPQSQSVDMEGALTAAGYANDDRGDPGPLAGSNGDFVVVGGGGSGTIYVEDAEDVAGMAQIVSELPGVDFVATREPVPGLPTVPYDQIGLDHQNSGDITAFMEPHWHDGDSGNVLPGNHGHPPTQHSVLLVAGGHPLVRDGAASVQGEAVYDPGVRLFSPPAGGPGNLSIAPTVAALFGLGQPPGGYDGAPLQDAFEAHAFVPHAPCEAAKPSYPRPRGATPLRVPLVPAFRQCTEPNRQHGPPLAHPSCAPPRRESDDLTVGTPDSNGNAANSNGLVRFAVVPGDPATPADEADVRLDVSLTDVRRAGDLSDYDGELLLDAGARITDRRNGAAADEPATMVDVPFPAIVGCAPTASTATGATCSLASSFDAILPGVIAEGDRAVWQLGAVEVRDGGSDGDPRTHPNGLFARQGLFVP